MWLGPRIRSVFDSVYPCGNTPSVQLEDQLAICIETLRQSIPIKPSAPLSFAQGFIHFIEETIRHFIG